MAPLSEGRNELANLTCERRWRPGEMMIVLNLHWHDHQKTLPMRQIYSYLQMKSLTMFVLEASQVWQDSVLELPEQQALSF